LNKKLSEFRPNAIRGRAQVDNLFDIIFRLKYDSLFF
jgi:hypothetical protein